MKKDLTKKENLGKMTEGYAKMLKFISIRQDISDVKDSAREFADRLEQGEVVTGLPWANTVRALLDYIESLEEDLAYQIELKEQLLNIAEDREKLFDDGGIQRPFKT
jgi:hypothetical protein